MRAPGVIRPGRAQDLPQLFELWRREVTEGRQDMIPNEARLSRMLGRFDWEAKSRVLEHDGGIIGSVLVMSRPSPEGVMTNVYAAGDPDRKSTRLNSSHLVISYAVFCLKKKK